MKKITTLFLSLSLCASIFTSCSSDDDNTGKTDDFKNYPYSTLTTSQQKEKLGQDANSFISSIEGLNTAKSVTLLKSLTDLLDIAKPNFDNGQSLRTSASIIYINEFYGEFSWDKTNKTWVKTTSADKLIFKFPSSATSTSNDGKVEVTGLSSGTNDGKYELPKELNALLYVGTANVGSIQVKGTDVNGTAVPKAAQVKFVLDSYTLSMNAEKGTKNTASFKLTNGNIVLLDGNADLIGNLDNAVNNDDLSSAGAGNTEIKIMDNLVIYGNSDCGKIVSEMNTIEENNDNLENHTDATRKTYSEALAACYNKNSALVLASRGDKTKIAKVGVRSKERTSTWNTEKYYEEIPTLVFGDNTVVDADVYFGAGFDQVMTNWNNFINKF